MEHDNQLKRVTVFRNSLYYIRDHRLQIHLFVPMISFKYLYIAYSVFIRCKMKLRLIYIAYKSQMASRSGRAREKLTKIARLCEVL